MIMTIDEMIAELERIRRRDGHGQTWIFCGDDKELCRDDLVIERIIRKPIGFDESNRFYYTLVCELAGDGCIKFRRR